jgi:putative ATP-dependent endonuclease of OLD family
LDLTEPAKALRSELIQKADAANAGEGIAAVVKADDIKSVQAKPEIWRLWDVVRAAKLAFDDDKTRYPELEAAIEAFFAWEKKNVRRECIRKAEQAEVKAAKLALIWELRKAGIFVLERGALDDYYPPEVTGFDKPSKALAFRNAFSRREQVLPLSPQQTCPTTGTVSSEFEFIFSTIFA